MERIPVGGAHNARVTARVAANPIWQRESRTPILVNRLRRKLLHQFSSLGGGNHFLEVEQDQTNRVWVMLHSGSRYLGVIDPRPLRGSAARVEGIDRRIYAKLPHYPPKAICATIWPICSLPWILPVKAAKRC